MRQHCGNARVEAQGRQPSPRVDLTVDEEDTSLTRVTLKKSKELCIQNCAQPALRSSSLSLGRKRERSLLASLCMDTKYQRIRTLFDEQIPFNKLVGMKVTILDDGHATIRVPFKPELVGDPKRPALHGGVLSALIDAAGGAAAFTRVNLPGDTLSTLDMRVDYLRPAALRDVIAEARVSRMGNRVASVDIVCYHEGESDRHLATGKAVYSVRRA